jgi:O-antigen ligase
MSDLGHPIGRAPVLQWTVPLASGLLMAAAAAMGFIGSLTALVIAVAYLVATVAPGVILAIYLTLVFYKAALQPIVPIDVTPAIAAVLVVQAIPLIRLGTTGIRTPWLIAWLAFGGLMTLGVFYTTDQATAIDVVVKWWLLVVLPLLAAPRIAASPTYLRQFVLTIAAVSLAAILVGGVSFDAGTRLQIFGENTIQSARVLLIVPLLGLVAFLEIRRAWVWLFIPLIPAGLFLSLATGSRGPVLAFAIVGAVLLLQAATRRANRLHAFAIGLSALAVPVALVLLGVAIPEASLDRFGSLLSGEASDTAVQRAGLFGIALDMFINNPLLGLGTSSYLGEANASLGYGGTTYPHNALLQAGAELGILGMTLLAGLLWGGLTSQHPRTTWWSAIRALLVFFMLNAMLSGSIYEDRLLWGLLIIVFAAPALAVGARASVETAETERPRWMQPALESASSSREGFGRAD